MSSRGHFYRILPSLLQFGETEVNNVKIDFSLLYFETFFLFKKLTRKKWTVELKKNRMHVTVFLSPPRQIGGGGRETFCSSTVSLKSLAK